MRPIVLTCGVRSGPTPVKSSKARSPPTCRCYNQRNSSSSSICPPRSIWAARRGRSDAPPWVRSTHRRRGSCVAARGARDRISGALVGCDMSIMGTGIYGAAPRWTRIGAIMVVCFWYDALAADQLPRQIVGGWCVAIERMLPGKTYTYWRCKDSNWDIIVRWDGFDAQETSCELNTIKRQGAAWLATFGCSGAGLTWLEDDEIRVGKHGWTLEAKIKNVRRVGDPIRYCVANKC